MIIYANGKAIEVVSVVSTNIRRDGKQFPALKFVFPGNVTAEEIAALSSGNISVDSNAHDGYTTLGEISVTVGKITTAESELKEAQEVIGIITGGAEITPAVAAAQRVVIEEAVQALPDESALLVKTYYPAWSECVEKGSIVYDKPGFKFTHENALYSCINANPTFQADWIPGIGTESLYTRIDEAHAGTEADPIPYSGNMILSEGLYYKQDGVVYKCVRDSGIALHNALADLVGNYVEVVTE